MFSSKITLIHASKTRKRREMGLTKKSKGEKAMQSSSDRSPSSSFIYVCPFPAAPTNVEQCNCYRKHNQEQKQSEICSGETVESIHFEALKTMR